MSYNLFLDNEREPWEVGNYIYPVELRPMYRLEKWVIVRNYIQFVQQIENYGMPKRISFDHDLGDLVLHKTIDKNGKINYNAKEFNPPLQKTGWHCAKWLLDYITKDEVMPELFVHSENLQGKENIKKLFI